MQMDTTRAKLCFIACLIVSNSKVKSGHNLFSGLYVKRIDEKSTVALKIRHD